MKKENCADCGTLFRIRCLQKYKGKLICKGCKRKKEKKKGFVTPLDIRKEEIELEKKVPKLIKVTIKKKLRKGMSSMAMNLKKYFPKEVVKIKETKLPKIPGSKVKKKYNKNLRFGLSFDEKKFLLRKHMNHGLDFENARELVNQDKKYLKEFVKKMKEEKKSGEEMSRKFKEEFAKLLEK